MKSLLRLLFIVSVVGVLGGCASSNTNLRNAENALFTIDELKQRAEMASYQGMHAQALREYQTILQRDPDNIEALLGVAEALMSDGRAAQAEVFIDRALVLEPGNLRAREERALAWLMQGRYMTARAELQQLADEDVNRWRVWNGLGVVADLDGRYANAIGYYQRAADLAPRRAILYNNLGYSLLMARDFVNAERKFREALQYHADNDARMVNNLAIAIAWQGRYNEAVGHLRRVMDEAAANNNVGYVAYLNGDYRQAEAMFKKAMSLRPTYYKKAADNLDLTLQRQQQASSGYR